MRHLFHLAGRFFRSLMARRPRPRDQIFVARHLPERVASAFWRQPVADLAQAVRGARRLSAEAPGRSDLIRAFLVHDIGKRHSRLGTILRAVVTAASLLRLPVGPRGRAYLDHAERGAVELEALGCRGLVVAFARYHHGACPPGVDADDWDLLVEADRA